MVRLALLLLTTALYSSAAWAQERESLGARGQFAFFGNTSASLSHVFGGESGSHGAVALSPGLDWFVLKGLSLGGSLDFAHISAETSSWNRAGASIRLGYNVRLSERLSIWPAIGVGYWREWMRVTAVVSNVDGSSLEETFKSAYDTVSLSAMLPLVFEPVPHFLVGFGPRATVSATAGSRDRIIPVDMVLTLGGYL